MSVKPSRLHQAFIKAIGQKCEEQGIAFSYRKTKSGYMVRAGNATASWHASNDPWNNRNIRRLGLPPALMEMQP